MTKPILQYDGTTCLKVRLLSPQHWAKTQNDNKPKIGTYSRTCSTNVKLFWQQDKYKLTVPLSEGNNVATLHMSPGYNKYELFCKEAEITDEDENAIICDKVIAQDNDIIKIPSIGTEWLKQSKSVHFKDESQITFDLDNES